MFHLFSFRAYQYGYAIMRPLMYDFPEEREVYHCDYQYMFGDSFMIAPIYESSGNEAYLAKREVYLPQGEWIEYSTKKKIDGGRYITCCASAEEMPVFVRNGSVIPYAEEIFSMKQYNAEKLRIEVYPTTEGSCFEFYDDDGEKLDYQRGMYDLIRIKARKMNDFTSIQIETLQRKKIQRLDLEFCVYDDSSSVQINGETVHTERRESCIICSYRYCSSS